MLRVASKNPPHFLTPPPGSLTELLHKASPITQTHILYSVDVKTIKGGSAAAEGDNGKSPSSCHKRG